MPEQNKLVTVFRSADPSAEAEAVEIATLLAEAGIEAVVLGDDAPGVVEGTWEVRVPPRDRARAESIIGAPRPARDDEDEVSAEALTHDLDFVTLFRDQSPEAEMEAISIRALLEANGIPSVMIGSAQFPSLPFEVRVPKSRLEEATSLLEVTRQSAPPEEPA
jgi:hypothetical protein